jgi:hypothetical protein
MTDGRIAGANAGQNGSPASVWLSHSSLTMRLTALIATLMSLAPLVPAFADDVSDLPGAKAAILAANLPPRADLDLWCMAELNQESEDSTKRADIKENDSLVDALSGDVAAVFGANSLPASALSDDLINDYMVVVSAETVYKVEPPKYTSRACLAAAKSH